MLLEQTAVDDVVVLQTLQIVDFLLQRCQLFDQLLVLCLLGVAGERCLLLVVALVKMVVLWILRYFVAQQLWKVIVFSFFLCVCLFAAHDDLWL